MPFYSLQALSVSAEKSTDILFLCRLHSVFTLAAFSTLSLIFYSLIIICLGEDLLSLDDRVMY